MDLKNDSNNNTDISKGRFIVIEGPDGVGKTSVINNIKLKLDKEKVVFLYDPYGDNHITSLIKDILCNNYDKLQKETAIFLLMAERIELNKIIEKYLNDGLHVICDRYTTSLSLISCINDNNLRNEIISIHKKENFPFLSNKLKLYIDYEIILLNHPDNKLKNPDNLIESVIGITEINNSYNSYFYTFMNMKNDDKKLINERLSFRIIDKKNMSVIDSSDLIIDILKRQLPEDCFI